MTLAHHATAQQSIFAVAHTDLTGAPFNNRGRTLRLVVEPNVEAHALTVRFANPCGDVPLAVGAASVAACDAEGNLVPGTLVPLTVQNRLDFMLSPGEEAVSDPAPFVLHPGEPFALNIYYPSRERVVSGNWVANVAARSRTGNYSADVSLSVPNLMSRFARTVIESDMTVSITSVCDIVAHTEQPGRVVACFGDSITQQGNWTTPLAKLLHHKYPGEVSLLNLGISGNRLLHDSPPDRGGLDGIAGVRRFARDVLALSGLTHAILEIGTNDIGLPGEGSCPESDLITLDEYTAGMQELADALHRRGVRVYAATLCPRPMRAPYTPAREALRQSMNTWIRETPLFDAVLDFDAVLRRGDGVYGMREGCHLPDGLHPSPYGGLWMAKSIDLALFAAAEGGEEAEHA